jgi:kynureninase
MMEYQDTLAFAQTLDQQDELRAMREKFIIPVHNGHEHVYMLGNSLGLQPRSTRTYIDKIFSGWSDYGVEAFFMGDDPWMNYHDQLIKPLSVITGALPHELSVMNQLTVNLHLMLVSFYRPAGRKRKILCEKKAFPSDQYTFETYVKHLGQDPEEIILELGPREGENIIRLEDICQVIEENKEEIALVFCGGLNYYTGQLFDIASMTKAAHDANIMVGFDLAHAAGNVELKLHEWDVDFACWCSYKYLNSGPGAVGGVYIHERFHKDPSINRLAGWWGYDKATRFKMEKGFKPIPTAEGWQLSTPSLLLYACHLAALKEFEEAGWDKILQKQKKLNAYVWYLLNELNTAQAEQVINILTPPQERGCQVSLLMLKNGKAVYDGLMKKGIIVDWREPDVIRLAPVPLYNSFEDVWIFYAAMKELLSQ